MMKKQMLTKTKLVGGLLSIGMAFSSMHSMAATELLDRVVVRVNESVVLQSEINSMVAEFKAKAEKEGQALPRDKVLETQVTERLIRKKLQLALADRMGLRISDAQIDQAIKNIAADEKMSVAEFRVQLASEGVEYQTFREQIREDMTLGDVTRLHVRNRINVTPQEIDNLAKLMEEQGKANMEINFGHIMVAVNREASKAEIEKEKARADKIFARLEGGADFKRTALSTSQGPKALDGGDWGWMNINEAPTLIAEQIKDAEKGALVGPFRSGAGFHIVKVFDIRGVQTATVDEVRSRHILVKPSIILSEQKAKQMLTEFVAQLREDDNEFAALAKEYSEDPGSASRGGDLGWSNPDIYVPAFKNVLANLKPNQISEPFRSTHGWHIVQLLERRTLDATADRWRERAYQLLANRKYNEESARWLQELRQDAYIEVLNSDEG